MIESPKDNNLFDDKLGAEIDAITESPLKKYVIKARAIAHKFPPSIPVHIPKMLMTYLIYCKIRDKTQDTTYVEEDITKLIEIEAICNLEFQRIWKHIENEDFIPPPQVIMK